MYLLGPIYFVSEGAPKTELRSSGYRFATPLSYENTRVPGVMVAYTANFVGNTEHFTSSVKSSAAAAAAALPPPPTACNFFCSAYLILLRASRV